MHIFSLMVFIFHLEHWSYLEFACLDSVFQSLLKNEINSKVHDPTISQSKHKSQQMIMPLPLTNRSFSFRHHFTPPAIQLPTPVPLGSLSRSPPPTYLHATVSSSLYFQERKLRAQSPGREEVNRLFGRERRRSRVIEEFLDVKVIINDSFITCRRNWSSEIVLDCCSSLAKVSVENVLFLLFCFYCYADRCFWMLEGLWTF